MPYLYSIKRCFRLFIYPLSLVIIGSVFASVLTQDITAAATDHCIVVAADKETATYYKADSGGCGKGTKVTLYAISAVSDQFKIVFTSISDPITSTCAFLSANAKDSGDDEYCVNYTVGDSSAKVTKSSGGQGTEEYSTDVVTRTSVDDEKDSAGNDAAYAALVDALGNSYKDKYNSKNCQDNWCADGSMWKSFVASCYPTKVHP